MDLVYDCRKDGLDIRIACLNMLNLWRAERYLTKALDMIYWIKTFDNSTFLLDILANICLYSIYAAKKSVKKIISIEPESQNYGLLKKIFILIN